MNDNLNQKFKKYINGLVKSMAAAIFFSLPNIYSIVTLTPSIIPEQSLLYHMASGGYGISLVFLMYYLIRAYQIGKKIKKVQELKNLQKPPQSDKEIFLFIDKEI